MIDQMTRAEYNEETGVSVVTLNTPYGVFTNKSTVHEEDKDIANRWDGIFFAYQKCLTDKLRGKARMYEHRREGVEYAMNVLRHQQRDCPTYDFGDAFLCLERVADTIDNDALVCRKLADKRDSEYKEMVDKILAKRRELRELDEDKDVEEE